MKKPITLACISIFAFFLVGKINGQKSEAVPVDRLKMNLRFDNEILRVKAVYTRTEKILPSKNQYFALNPGSKINSVKASGLQSCKFAPKAGRPFPYLLLEFNEEIRSGQKLEVEFDYEIDLAKLNHIKSNWIELNIDKFWSPLYEDIDTKVLSDVHLENLPPDYSFVSYPNVKIRKNTDDSYDFSTITPGAEVLILAGKKMKFWSKKANGINVKFFAFEGTTEEKLESMYLKVHNSILFFNSIFGKLKPIKDFTVVLRRITRQEISGQYQRIGLVVTGEDFDTYGNMSHEIAHFWWGDADYVNEPWMNEAFANYSMYILLEKHDPDSFKHLYAQDLKVAETAPPIVTAVAFSKNASRAYYYKGGIVLKKLEAKIGRDKMLILLANRVKKKINKAPDFLNDLEKVAGKEARQYFEKLINE